MNTDAPTLLNAGTEVLLREAMLLDERRWDEWLALYLPECSIWMPMWRDENTLNDDPRTSLSHLYYDSRKGLEDRVARLRSSRHAPSATPLPRTAHLVSNVLALEPPTPERMRLRSTWACHVLYLRTRHQHVFFGSAEVELNRGALGWQIARKKIVLQNDDVPTMLDFYCV